MEKSFGKAVLMGTVCSFLSTLVFSVGYSVVLCYTNVSEQTLPVAGNAIFLLSVLIGGAIAAKISGKKGLIHGLAVAMLFFIAAVLISETFLAQSLSAIAIMKKGALAFLGGAIGGIIGIGLVDHK